MTMLTDGIKSKSLEDEVKQLDVAELLERSCIPSEKKVEAPPAPAPPEEAPAPPVEANAE